MSFSVGFLWFCGTLFQSRQCVVNQLKRLDWRECPEKIRQYGKVIALLVSNVAVVLIKVTGIEVQAVCRVSIARYLLNVL